MANKRESTKFPGVYRRNLETTGNKKDVAFDIVYRHDKRKIFERVGKLSEGYSAKLAADVRSERIRSIRHSEELPYQKKKAMTFEKLAEKYIKWSEENKSRAGIDDKSRYENHLKARFDNKRLDEISPFDLERMKSEMAKSGIAPKTISHCLGLLRAMYNKSIEWNLYQGENPVKKIKMPTVQNARDRFLSMEEAEKLLMALKRNPQIKKEYKETKDPKLHDIALLSLHTGARAGEIFNIKKQDVDFENELIALRDTKNTETRYAPMTVEVKKMLKRRIENLHSNDNKEPSDNSNSYIFTDKDGNKINEVSNAFNRIVNDLGFNNGVTDPRQRVVFHTLRHTFASWLAIQGTPLYTIAKLMGHKSIAMSERYAHLSPDHKKDAVNAVVAALKKQKKATEISAEG
jgi:integrase